MASDIIDLCEEALSDWLLSFDIGYFFRFVLPLRFLTINSVEWKCFFVAQLIINGATTFPSVVSVGIV